MDTAIVQQVQGVHTGKPKWANGETRYWACDHATYLKLKRINHLFQHAIHMNAVHDRWYAKLPHNRVIHTYSTNEQNQRNGITATRPIPEPKLYEGDHPDCAMRTVAPIKENYRPSTYIVVEDYERARTPHCNQSDVRALNSSISEINRVLTDLETWYASLK